MRHSLGPGGLLLRAALGLAAFALIAGSCGDGRATVEETTSTSTPYAASMPTSTFSPVATATPERVYIPPSTNIAEENRTYLGSVVDLEDALILVNNTDTETGYKFARYLMKKGAEVRAPASGTIVGIYGDATSIYKGIEIQYAPKGLVRVGWVGSWEEFVAGSSITEGSLLGSIGEGLYQNSDGSRLNPDANLIIRHRTGQVAHAQTDIYVDESGRLYIQ